MESKTRLIVGSVLVIGGLLMAANGIIAGPHAFAEGHRGVLSLVGMGVVAIAALVWEVVRAKAR
jgi:hypothetical protein